MPSEQPPEQPSESALIGAWNAYRGGDTATGIAQAEGVVASEPSHGEGWYVLALNLERAGRLGEADRCFQRAGRATVAPQSPPYRVSWRRFENVVELAASGLPEPMRKQVEEVALVLADYPDPGQVGSDADVDAEMQGEVDEEGDSDATADADTEFEVLGLFEGLPRSERSDADPQSAITPRISLFRRAHEHAAGSRADFTAQVRTTLIHELGHYLGYGENDLERLGLD